MSIIEDVKTIDNFIEINTVFVSCTDKRGLVANDGIKGLDSIGLLGVMQKANPNILFIATGETYKIIKNGGFNVIEVAEYTKYPEMVNGLVKSLHPKIHAGILGHKYTNSDVEYFRNHNIRKIDVVIVNFYDLKSAINDHLNIEEVRQAIDVGGPTLCHSARKSFLNTAVVTSINEYREFSEVIEKYNGRLPIDFRLNLVKRASRNLTNYYKTINQYFQKLSIEDIKSFYDIVGGE